MKTVLAFWAGTIALLSGLLFWRNKGKYPSKTVTWLMTKSLAEVTILIVSAIRMPALLFAWIGMWVTKPIKAQWLRTTVGIILAISLGYLGIFAMEIVLLLSVFSIDEITGENSGFLSNWKKAKANDDARIKAFYQAA